MDILEKIEEVKVRFDQTNELSSSDKSFIESIYERVLSKRFNNRGCGQCYRDAFIEIYVQVKKNGIKDMGNFVMKREVVRTIDGIVYSRNNITDEAAIKLLKTYPQRIDDFESYPKNWEELIAGKAKETKVNTEPKKKAGAKKASDKTSEKQEKSEETKVNTETDTDPEKVPTDNEAGSDNSEEVTE